MKIEDFIVREFLFEGKLKEMLDSLYKIFGISDQDREHHEMILKIKALSSREYSGLVASFDFKFYPSDFKGCHIVATKDLRISDMEGEEIDAQFQSIKNILEITDANCDLFIIAESGHSSDIIYDNSFIGEPVNGATFDEIGKWLRSNSYIKDPCVVQDQ